MIGYVGAAREARRQADAQRSYNYIYDHYLADSQAANQGLTAQQRAFALQRAGYAGDLTRALDGGGGLRELSYQQGQQQAMQNSQGAIARMMAQNPDGSGNRFTNMGGANSFDTRAARHTQAILSPAQVFAAQQAGSAARSLYDQNAYNQFAERNADVGRRTNEATNLAQLLQAERDRALAEGQRRFGYQGPSNAYYNMMLLSQGLQAGGRAYETYSATQPAGQQQKPTSTTWV
jgi:hypothetical protein